MIDVLCEVDEYLLTDLADVVEIAEITEILFLAAAFKLRIGKQKKFKSLKNRPESRETQNKNRLKKNKGYQ